MAARTNPTIVTLVRNSPMQEPIMRINVLALKLERKTVPARSAAVEHRERDLELLNGDGRLLRAPWTGVDIHSFTCRVLRMGGACKSMRDILLRCENHVVYNPISAGMFER